MTQPVATGVLLFAHGARDPAWAGPFEAVAAQLRAARPGVAVRLAFLEFMTPDLPTAGDALASTGCTTVQIVPLFLGAGGHVRKDLPRLVGELQQRHPQVQWQLQPAVGEEPAVVAAMAAVAASHVPGAGA